MRREALEVAKERGEGGQGWQRVGGCRGHRGQGQKPKASAAEAYRGGWGGATEDADGATVVACTDHRTHELVRGWRGTVLLGRGECGLGGSFKPIEKGKSAPKLREGVRQGKALGSHHDNVVGRSGGWED